jgi:hypothetical protein
MLVTVTPARLDVYLPMLTVVTDSVAVPGATGFLTTPEVMVPDVQVAVFVTTSTGTLCQCR